MKRVLSFDYGATSGRAMLSELSDGKITIKELHRFDNCPVEVGGVLYWDILRLYYELKTGLVKAKLAGGFDSIGIDTWGVDFGLIDKSGRLMANPVHYRDKRTSGLMEETFKQIPKEEIYSATGIQFLQFNTIYQLMYLKKYEPETLNTADKLLFIPDLLAYFLTGEIGAERTVASTSQLYSPITHDWAWELIDKCGFPRNLFPPISDSGSIRGTLNSALCEELDISSVPVIAVCEHDTASAVVSVPSLTPSPAYISCGTWSLLGTELKSPKLDENSFKNEYTNEIGYDSSVRYLKNIMGLWIINECKRDWEKQGIKNSYGEIMELARKSSFESRIDVDSNDFIFPYDMPKKVQNYCKRTNQPIPETVGDIARCVYTSLADKYALALDTLSKLTNIKFDALHIIGGGVNATLLMELARKACEIPVIAGPDEATVLGNAAVQLIALGQIDSIKSAREIIKNSVKLVTY